MTGHHIPIVEGFVDLDADQMLIASVCTACGTTYLPASSRCRNPGCLSDRLDTRRIGDRGELLSWTRQIYQPPAPFRMDDWEPHLIGLVLLEEGLQVIGMLSGVDESELSYRMPVATSPLPLYTNADGDVVVTYAFSPRRDGAVR
jgi:uncharacterized protein